MSTFGYSGSSYDRFVGEQTANQFGDSTLNKMQHHFWVAKQTVLRRLGKKEDDCVVASDAELDAKLELFFSIQETCQNLYKILELYQDRLHVLVQEESSMGHFLKDQGTADKTRAGKMMVAVGKAMLYTAHQRVALRFPLVRLHQEVETFCQRAIEDTAFTVNEMEKCRNEYRGALLWMKNVSQSLNPDTFKELEKFRKVQAHVRDGKGKFDRHKLACLQKIDLLAAARCNMFSNGLIIYQNNLTSFWQRSAKALNAVSNAFKGYQPYEFSVVAELRESSIKLADDTNSTPDAELEFFFENEFRDAGPKSTDQEARKEDKKAEPSESSAQVPVQRPVETSSAIDELLGLDQQDALLLELDQLGLGNPTTSVEKPQKNEDNWTPFMPSNWLDTDLPATTSSEADLLLTTPDIDLMNLDLTNNEPEGPGKTTSMLQQMMNKAKGVTNVRQNQTGKTQGKDLSWYNLFAELDPLANPDAVGKDKNDDGDRNC